MVTESGVSTGNRAERFQNDKQSRTEDEDVNWEKR